MRLLKVERNQPKTSLKKYDRNCIAVPDIKVNAQKKTYAQKKALERAQIAPSTFACRQEKLSRRVTLADLRRIVAKEARDFYAEVNKKLFYGTCTTMAAMLFSLVFNVNFCFAYSAMLGDTNVGVVPSKEYVEEIIQEVNAENAPYLNGTEVIDETPVLLPTVVSKDAYTAPEELKESVKSTSDVMVQAYALRVDDYTVAALESQEAADQALQTYLAQFVPENEDVQYRFDDVVQVEYEYVPQTLLRSVDATVIELGGVREEIRVAELSEGDTIQAVLDYYGMDEADFRALNMEIGDTLEGVETVLVRRQVPMLAVVTDQTVQFEDVVPFETQTIEDPELYEGTQQVEVAGVDGTKTVVETVSKVNGEVTETQVAQETVETQPVTQVVRVGTKPRPSNVGTGSFIRPYYGAISSRFGPRWSGTHTGVDFCGTQGDPVVAADNGTVEFVGWSGGYGNLVKINHNNGYVTYYAHNSKLLVNVGDTVAKGDTIALLGSTGNSTGPHCHFEVRKNGEIMNPMDYVE